MKIAALCAVIVLSSGCAGPVKGLYPPAEGESAKAIYVVSHGWHTGVVVRRQDIPDGIWPEHNDFADSEYVEVGWGDRDFYRAPEATSGLALKAVFWPTSSVLHIVGFDDPVGRALRGSDIIAINVSDRGHKELSTFIQDAYARDESGRAIPLGPGQHKNSRFYLASEKYYLLKTCNNWTARALRSAGVPITPLYAVTAGNVMYQVGKFGRATRWLGGSQDGQGPVAQP
ncbi:MAG: DUF2459 domain-containing protein [Candidatus Methylomirabilia bacterium]